MKKILALTMALVLMLGTLGLLASCGNTVRIPIYTGSTGGTYYAFTNGLQTQLAAKTGYTFTVVGDTGGSVANLKAIGNGDCKMAIVQNDTMVNAYNGLTNNFEAGAITNFSVIGQVYPEVIQIVTDDASIQSLADLKGKGLSVSIGDVGSGVEANAVALLQKHGIDVTYDAANKKYTSTDIVIQNLSVAKSADAMKEDKLDVFFFTSGAPATSITEIALAKTVHMVALDDAVMDEFIAENKIDGKYDVYSKQPITNAQYSFIPADAPVYTIGVSATYIIANSVGEEEVYNITKALWESKGSIGHAVESTMNTEYAFVTIGNVPVHPGAARYYQELGMTVENIATLK